MTYRQKLNKVTKGGLLLFLGVVASFVAAPQAHAANPAYGNCQVVRRAVALAPGQPANQTISGQLCTPKTWAAGAHRIDILVHGATYNRNYWDWPQNNETYSYVNRTLKAGRATFAYDRIGAGQSSRPLSTAASVQADAHVLHQLIQWLQPTYPGTTVVGHSLGSVIATREAATYNDGKRLVVTGLMHGTGVGIGLPTVLGSFYPAALDPAFSGLLDPGYLTTQPGTRGTAFYYGPGSDPAVIAYDEAHKDLLSATELAAVPTELETLPPLNAANGVRVPTLHVVGQQDALWCGVVLDCTQESKVFTNERPFYSAAPNFTVKTIPNTGHDLNTHLSAAQSHAAINTWITQH